LQAGRSRRWATGLALCLVVAGAVVLLHRPQTAVVPDRPDRRGAARAAPGSSADRADASTALLQRLVPALQRGSTRQVAALAAPGDHRALSELVSLRHNVRALGITDLRMRYVDKGGGRLSLAPQRPSGGAAWVGKVQVSWRLRGFDRHDSRTEVPVAFRQDGARTSFVTARRGGRGGATPLWMLQRLTAARDGRSMVVAGGDEVHRFSRLAARSVVDVDRVLHRWRGRLVVEVPDSSAVLDRSLGARSGAYDAIAAVTTTADGSVSPTAPVHIFVNPAVFALLGPRGAQIVMSHEATHVATNAALSTMPPWLLEGFADYVALAHVHLPVSLTASQILTQVRRGGPPDHLPGQADFDTENPRLGASYESAWLACRLLAERYGEKRLVRFYRASAGASSTRTAFRALGTDQRAFTRAWRQDLRRLAG
jgi:hypothetical protein